MLEIKVSIVGLEQLTEAITFMASALAHANGMKNTVKALEEIKPKTEKTEPKPVQEEEVVSTSTVTVPTNAKEYTLDELSKAAVGLLDKGLADELTNLLAEFGVNSLPELDKTVYSQFALKIREMGADI